jgi:hypothetical protein
MSQSTLADSGQTGSSNLRILLPSSLGTSSSHLVTTSLQHTQPPGLGGRWLGIIQTLKTRPLQTLTHKTRPLQILAINPGSPLHIVIE